MHGGDVHPVEQRDGERPSERRPRPGRLGRPGRPGRLARASPLALAAAPLLALVLVVAVLLVVDPVRAVTGTVPVESLAVERVVLEPGRIELRVRNDGRTDVTLAQVQVNGAYWQHTTDEPRLGRLGGTRVVLDYPWERGVPLRIALVTGTGVVVDHEIDNPRETLRPSGETARRLAVLGLLIAPVPIAIGLAWLPAVRRSRPAWFDAAMAFTVGLLAFLVVDSAAEGLDAAGEAPGVLDGVGLFAVGALGSVAVLAAAGDAGRGTVRMPGHGDTAVRLAVLVAVGIGLHNFGEGLAVGAAISTGEVALGTALVVAFTLHNATEGLAIAGPLGGAASASPGPGVRGARRSRAWVVGALAGLIAISGLPVVGGLWLGGLVLPAGWAALAFGVAAGAVAQVAWAVARWLHGRGAALTPLNAGAFVAAVVAMYLTGVLAG
jgi:zinc transporter ZupT